MNRQQIGNIPGHADDREPQPIDPMLNGMLCEYLIRPDHLGSGRAGRHRFLQGPREFFEPCFQKLPPFFFRAGPIRDTPHLACLGFQLLNSLIVSGTILPDIQSREMESKNLDQPDDGIHLRSRQAIGSNSQQGAPNDTQIQNQIFRLFVAVFPARFPRKIPPHQKNSLPPWLFPIDRRFVFLFLSHPLPPIHQPFFQFRRSSMIPAGKS